MTAHNLPDVKVIADAGLVSDAKQQAIEDAGLSFILGARVLGIPYPVAQWRDGAGDAPQLRIGC